MAGSDEQRGDAEQTAAVAQGEARGARRGDDVGRREDGEDEAGMERGEPAALLQVEGEDHEERSLPAPECQLSHESGAEGAPAEQVEVKQRSAAACAQAALMDDERHEQEGSQG